MNNQEVDKRIRCERTIIRALVKQALKLGYFISVDDGEDVPCKKSRSYLEIMSHIQACDDEYLHFDKGMNIGPPFHFMVYLVYGNDGFDVIANHSWPENGFHREMIEAVLSTSAHLSEIYADR